MATIDIPIDDAFLSVAIEKIALYLNYKDEIEDIDPESPTFGEMVPNPDSKARTIKKQIYRSLKDMYVGGVKIQTDMVAQTTIDAAKADAEIGIGD